MGTAFSWKSTLEHAEIREISGTHGWWVDQIKVKTSDGNEEQTSPAFGAGGGGPYKWVVPAGEHITKIEYKKTDFFIGITFITDKGTRSPQYGGLGGHGVEHTYLVPPGQRLSGIFGYADAYIRGLGFYLAQAPSEPSQTPLLGIELGAAFSWKTKLRNADIREISWKDGWYIDEVKVKTADGANEETSPAFGGGGGGGPYKWVVPAGEHIAKVEYRTARSSAVLICITFITDKGTRSSQFGGKR